jgi:excisionase family DNA binding protein
MESPTQINIKVHPTQQVMKDTLITPGEAARLKDVSRFTIYSAIAQGRLPSIRILKRLALKRSDVLAWTPTPHAGRPKGFAVSRLTRQRMSKAQKRRWSRGGSARQRKVLQ